MMRRFACLALLLSAAFARADTEFLGMFVQGKRIGVVSSTRTEVPGGVVRTLSSSKIGAQVLGQGMLMSISTESVSKNGRLSKQIVNMETGGRSQRITALFGAKYVDVTREAAGQITKKQIEIPAGALLVDDPTFGLAGKGLPSVGTKITFYIFDPTVLNLIKNEAEFLGEKAIEVEGKNYSGSLLRVMDPRAHSDVYLDKNGNVILVVGIFGITMRPISREEALGNTGYVPSVDLASLSRIVPNKPITNPSKLKSITFDISGARFEKLKNDGYWQTVARTDRGLRVTIAPPKPSTGTLLKNLKQSQTKFTGPALYLPVNDSSIKRVARTSIGNTTGGHAAALRISKYVHRIMRPNATIGMLRDAREIFKTKEGVCRDYSILAASLMRAAGIPTKIVTGAVYAQDAFYYHAWVEAWDGKSWIALDPTLDGGLADATHIKFTEGDPETAFVTFILDGAKINIVSERR